VGRETENSVRSRLATGTTGQPQTGGRGVGQTQFLLKNGRKKSVRPKSVRAVNKVTQFSVSVREHVKRRKDHLGRLARSTRKDKRRY